MNGYGNTEYVPNMEEYIKITSSSSDGITVDFLFFELETGFDFLIFRTEQGYEYFFTGYLTVSIKKRKKFGVK